MGAAIEVTDLAKAYGELRAVDGVTFDVGEGEFFGILGPNGAGKTTILEMVEGLRRPDAGTITLLGQSPWPRNAGLLPRIGVQLQSTAFFERLTAREQIHTMASLYAVAPEAADEWLERVGLGDKADTRVGDLSGGQAQRLSIACALVHDPEVVFLDEPTIGVDPVGARDLRQMIADLITVGKTVLLTTHYMFEADALCDRIAVIAKGEIVGQGTPAQLKGNVAGGRVTEIEVFGVDEATVVRLRGVGGVTAVTVEEQDQKQLLIVQTTGERELTQPLLAELGGVEVGRVASREPTLEDAYVALVTAE
jgi:ABC-2 type transport system ATP-binding protein